MATLGEQGNHEGRVFTGVQGSVDEETPLLRRQHVFSSLAAPVEESLDLNIPWIKPKYFILIETAIFTNVFLAGFDGTVTASTYAVISSELQQSNLASWITTSYLLTSTAIQPLYGRFSDIFGRPTIINTDLIPKKHRGIYQAFQNILHGTGAICGTTLGGFISDTIGWRICFLSQVPVAMAGLCLASTVVRKRDSQRSDGANLWIQAKSQLDLLGATLLFAGLVLLLAALTLGVERSWDDPLVVALFLGLPILPLVMLKGCERVALLISNISLGITAYGILFLMPFFFQTVLLDKASAAGLRLVPPSLATPFGGLTTGIVMRRGGDHLTLLTRLGLILMLLSNILMLNLGIREENWKYSAYLILGNFAQGMVYPSILFGFIRTTIETGTVWGVSAVATLVQGSITKKLEVAFGDQPGASEALQRLLKSISAIRDLNPRLRDIAIEVYYNSCRHGLFFLFVVNALALGSTFFIPMKHSTTKVGK
ncbi:multidrug efflux transporter (Eurofung) [Fusarium beomiforme]|uniref:Multidrug efflux transporter (Eurofung) n=1 Tax=Fusarium beomiforme TaxID=44412 RepID=A0A9P5AFF1_9HYPO|nr:multidrug efflux transporter (Eurofung) [Fusarium beomiforme]